MSKSIFHEWIFGHAQYEQVFDQIQNNVYRALNGGQPFIFPLLGDSRAGKTALLSDILKCFEDRRSQSNHCMVLLVTMPAAASAEALAIEIIISVLGEVQVKGKPHEILRRARRTLEQAGIKVLLIDETNHLVEKRSTQKAQTKENRQLADWFKELADQSGISTVVSGLTHVARIYADNDQLQNRGLVGATIYPYAWNVPTDRSEYSTTIQAAITHFLDNGWRVEVSADQITRIAYLGGGGYVGKARDFLVRVEETGSEKKIISLKLLSRAYKDKYQLGTIGDPTLMPEIRDELLNASHKDTVARAASAGRGR